MAQTKSSSTRSNGSKRSGSRGSNASTKSKRSSSGSSSATKSRSSSSAKSSPKNAAASKAKKATAETKQAAGKSTARVENAAQKSASKAAEGASAAGSAVESATRHIKVPENMKTPALLAGAGLAGLAGGMALSRDRQKSSLMRGKPVKVKLPSRRATKATSKNLAHAAKNAGLVAERTGDFAQRVRIASEAMSSGDAANGRRRSPLEVVLEGLTNRSTTRSR